MFRTQRSLAGAYEDAKGTAKSIKAYCQSRAALFASTTPADVIIGTGFDLNSWRTALQDASLSGIAQYARDQEDDQNYDVVGAFTAMTAAIDAYIAELVNVLPTANGFIQARTLNPDGTITVRQIPPAALTTLVSLLNAIVASID